jgi:ubiquinone/menaquinone biosynthesis C-methylase UbiE
MTDSPDRRSYAEYRYRPTRAFLEQLTSHLGWTTSDRILDLGAGPAHVSLRLAPLVGEIVVMDPEPAMLEEGRRRAATAGVDNLAFALGGSDDLGRVAPDLA